MLRLDLLWCPVVLTGSNGRAGIKRSQTGHYPYSSWAVHNLTTLISLIQFESAGQHRMGRDMPVSNLGKGIAYEMECTAREL